MAVFFEVHPAYTSSKDLRVYFLLQTSSGRADPCAVCEENTSTPMEIAAREDDRKEVLAILGEFTEIPDRVKLAQLSKLMYVNAEETKEDFQKILSLVPVESVRAKI